MQVDSSSHALPPQIKTQFINAEQAWFQEDENILEFKAVKNELEAFLYEMRNNIGDYGPLERYIDPKIKSDYLQKINQAVEWIYGEGQSASKELYRQKLEEFKKVGVPVKQRASLHQDLPLYLEKFAQFQ